MSNEEQIEYWNGQAGATWVEAQEQLDALLAPFNDVLLEAAEPLAALRVLDVGCGCGDTSLRLADRGALVTGVDISEPMLARARARASDRDALTFMAADAATGDLPRDQALIVSRFGVMFFDDPTAAFSNLRRAAADGGRLVFACWQKPADNPWVSVGGRAVQPFLPEPATPPDPKAPGPFAFADADYVRDILQNAGFADVQIDGHRAPLRLGGTVDEALAFQGRVGPMARVLAELSDEAREQAQAAARDALAKHLKDDGVHLEGAIWLVRAQAN